MRILTAATLALVLCGHAIGVAAQTELNWCGTPPCVEVYSTHFLNIECPGYDPLLLIGVTGRWWWGPLLCAGPIQVSVQVSQAGQIGGDDVEALPLIVEARTDPLAAECQFPGHSMPGRYLWQTLGRISCAPDSLWEESPLIDLPDIVPLGSTYWLQIQGFVTLTRDGDITATSPFFSCIRLRAFPTMVTATTWGAVKSIYR